MTDLSKHTQLKGQMTTPAGSPPHGPEKTPEQIKTSDLARLHGAVWQATSYCTFDEIRKFVEGTLREVQADDQ